MATIRIQRTKGIQNYFRNIQIGIDGRIKGNIANGKTKEFEVSAGHHKIIASIDWCSSQELSFDCNENDVKTFVVSGMKNKWLVRTYLSLFALILLLLITIIIQQDNSNKLMYIAVPVWILTLITCGIILYFITFGRKKYLELKELA